MTTPQEAAVIRSQLKLRFNTNFGCWEVFTTIHGSGVFRWFKISASIKDWYIKNFPDIDSVDYGATLIYTNSGALTDYKETPVEDVTICTSPKLTN